MNRQEATEALIAAGKDGDVRAMIREVVKTTHGKYDQIRSDRTRTEESRQWQLAVACTEAEKALEARLMTEARKIIRFDRDDAERVFGVKGLDGDAASLVISRRDAADRVASVTKTDDLRELLRRATRSGDEVLARAVAERAVTNQDAETMNQFLEDRPDLESAGERLWRQQRAKGAGRIGTTMEMMTLIPKELTGKSFVSIALRADQAEPGAA